jgi:UDP-2,3-diacylglucosamine pyrophosphatase LpxH
METQHPENFRPPLANQLFDTRPSFLQGMERFPECREVIPMLRKPGVLIERELARIREQTKDFDRAHQELAAILYYLHFAIWECQRDWAKLHCGINNYVTFVREVQRWRLKKNEDVCFVTFNYDMMLEGAMKQVLGVTFDSFEKYLARDGYTLVKLHGSVNWGFDVRVGNQRPTHPGEVIEQAANLRIGDEFDFVTQHPMQLSKGVLGYPALSIPVERKDEFSCPKNHVEALIRALPSVTAVICIGWRAMELDFLARLREGLRGNFHLLVVSGDQRGADETFENLISAAIVPSHQTLVHNGFSGLINDLGTLDKFLA